MADCKIIFKDGIRNGVENDFGQRDPLFDEIYNNALVQDFEQALEIYKQIYSKKLEQPAVKKTSSTEQAIKRNNGNPLNLAPNGKPSILYQSYKDLGYSDSEAESLVAQGYSDSFFQFFGDYLKKSRYDVVTDFRFSNSNEYDFIEGFLSQGDFVTIGGDTYKVIEETEESGIYKTDNLKGNVKYVDSYKGKNPSFFTGQLDKNGQPILMHHNTDTNFYEFDLNYKGKNNSSGGSVGKGIYLSKSKTGADRYGGSVTKSFFVKANNPYSGIDSFSKGSIDLAVNLVNQEIDKSSHPDKEYAKEEAKNKIDSGLEKGKLPYVSGYLTPTIITEILKNEGFDSIKDGSNDFVVFNPNQIKSATENVGTFDSQSNDIRFQNSPQKTVETKEFNKTATLEKLKETGLAENILSESQFNNLTTILNKSLGGKVKIVSQEEFEKEAEKQTGETTSLKNKDGEVFGAVLPNGVMYLNQSKLNANTPIHEHTHLLNAIIQQSNPKLWKEIVAASKTTQEWKDVTSDSNYSNLTTDDQIADEVFSRIVGNIGEKNWEQYTNKPAYKKILDTIAKFFKEVQKLFGVNVYEGMSIEGLANLALTDLLGGRSISQRQSQETVASKLENLFEYTTLLKGVRFDIDSSTKKKLEKALGEKDGRALYKVIGNVKDVEKLIQFAKEKFPIKGTLDSIVNKKIELEDGSSVSFGESVIFEEYNKYVSEEAKEETTANIKRPDDLLNEVGYSLTQTKSQSEARDLFAKYYKSGELICTIGSDSSRHNNAFVTFIVREDAKETPHANDLTQKNLTDRWKEYLERLGKKKDDGTYDLSGISPKPLDPYSTSVVSLQINKTNGSTKEISRYNHTLPSPDNIFSKDFDKVAQGLSDALYYHFGVDKNKKQYKKTLPNNVVQDAEGRFFNYTRENNGVYYGEGFYVRGGQTTFLDSGSERMVEGFVINANGQVTNIARTFEDFLYGDIEKVNYIRGNEISVTTKQAGEVVFTTKRGVIEKYIKLDEEFRLENLSRIAEFVKDSDGNITLEEVSSVGSIKIHAFWGDDIIAIKGHAYFQNSQITNLGNLQSIGGYADFQNSQITNLGNLQSIGGYAYFQNSQITNLGNLQSIGGHADFQNSQNNADLLKTIQTNISQYTIKEVFKNTIRLFKDSVINKQDKTFNDFLPQEYKLDTQKPIVAFSTTKESPLRYRYNSKFYASYEEALKNSQSGEIEIGLNTLDGFKTLFKAEVNTNKDSLSGIINDLIKSNLIESSYKQDSKTILRPKGNSEAKRWITSGVALDTIKQYKGLRVAKQLSNGNIVLEKEGVALINKKGEIVHVNQKDINYKDFEEDILILAAQEFNKEYKTANEKPENTDNIVPENELQVKLITLLKQMGIKTMDMVDYITQYSDKNGVPPSAQALADLANSIIAFKDGIITEETLSEEMAHFIVASTPLAEKENLLRNVHKTKEWLHYSAEYMEIYQDEAQVREEILGKVLSNSLRSQFQAQENPVATSIIEKLKEMFYKFFEKVSNFLNPTIESQIAQYTKEVYKNLMNETLGSKLESVRGEYTLFSTGNATPQVSRIYDAAKDTLNTLIDQQRELSKKYKNVGNKNLLQRAKEILSEQEDKIQEAQKMKAFSNIIQVASSQINTLLKAPKEALSGQFHFSHEENTVFVTLTARVLPMLGVINSELKGKTSTEKALKKEIESVILKVSQLRGLIKKDNMVAVERLKQRVKDKANMSEKEEKEYDKLLTQFFNTAIEDTDWLHAHIGNLANAHNPLLNLAGDVIERTHLDSITNFQKPFKDMLNKVKALGFDVTKMDKITYNGEIINERDAEKVEKYDNELKSIIYNESIDKYLLDLTPSTPETIKEDLEKFFKMTNSETLEAQKLYNATWTSTIKNGREFKITNQNGTVEKLIVKPRFNSYFEKGFDKKLKEHEIKVSFNGVESTLTKIEIPSDVIERDKEYKARIMQIRENSKGILTEVDQYEIQEENKKRQEDKNPRDIEGNLIKGVAEAYDELSQRYLVVKDEEAFNNLNDTDQKIVINIIGLNILDFINQDFWAKENKDRPDGMPQKFIDKLNELGTEEEKLKFVQTNSYINFDRTFWDNFKQRDGLVDRLRKLETKEGEDLIKAIRKEQSIISGTLKNNAIYNKPSEINVVEMPAIELMQVKNSASILENLYTEAYKILPKQEQDALDADSVVNESYLKDLEDEKVNELEFLYKHTTSTAWASISQAKSLVAGLKDGTTKTVRTSMQGFFSNKMSNIELEEALLRYARTKVLPYYKRTEPTGYSRHLEKLNEGVKNNTEGTVLNYIINTPGLAVNANFSFYEDDSKINPTWKKNNEEKKEQFTQEYIEKVRNDKYYTYFGIGADGEVTQNLKDWQAREAILEYQDQMIEYNNLTGVQSRYMIPQVRKTTSERVVGISKNNIKQFFRDMTTFRPEEAEQGQTIGEEAAKKGSSLLTIPTYYNRKLEDPTELTQNTFHAYAIYGQAASLHKARRQNIGDMLVLNDVITNSNFDGKEAIATNAFKMLKSQLNANFYGVKETFSYESNVLGKKVDLGKVAKMFYNWVRFSNLAGITVPITSSLTAEVQKNIETIIGETSNRIAANEGNKLFVKYGTEAAKEVMGLTSNAFINVVGEALGMYNMSERFENSQYNKGTRGIAKASSHLHSLGNYPIIPRAFMSVFADYRYVNGVIINYKQFNNTFTNEKQTEIDRQWKEKLMFIEDVKISVNNGSMDFTNPNFLRKVKENLNLDGEELQKYLNEVKNRISQRALSAIQRIDTQIPEHQKSLAARDSRSNFFLMHLNYLLVQIPLKLKKKHYNISEETWQEGNWRTTYNFLGKMIINHKDIKKAWKESMGDDLTRTNLKRTVVELAVGNTLAIAAILLANYVDDEDDPAYLTTLADMFTTRLAVEMVGSTAGLPKQISGVIENPLITFQRLKDIGGIFDLFSSDTVERGTYAGDSERFRWMAKNLPFFRDYNRWSDPKQAQDTYNYFSVEKEDLYDNFAWFSNLVDDEEF